MAASGNQEINNIRITENLYLKPEYLNHPTIQGNKYRKLYYNLQEARRKGIDTLLTFGGAYSNHIVAVASAGQAYGFKTVGIIRGDELATSLPRNPSLRFAEACGMKLEFVSRDFYRRKQEATVIAELRDRFGSVYILPEGGTNELAVKGCEEILKPEDREFDMICCPVGTGGTVAGLINASGLHQTVLGFSALKGSFLKEEIIKFTSKENWQLISDYHFGGYAKINAELISFINEFQKAFGIPLDPVYTGKMIFGVYDMIKSERIGRSSRVLLIHTGGLQGIAGMNLKLKEKGMQQIDML